MNDKSDGQEEESEWPHVGSGLITGSDQVIPTDIYKPLSLAGSHR